MARPREPVDLIAAKGRKHLTIAEYVERKNAEIAAPADKVKPPDFLLKKEKEKFDELAKQLVDLKIMTNLDCDVLARYIKAECHEFRPLMDEALEADVDDFADALYKVKECSKNIIDSYTQPFYGLVKFAREEPETVQQMFMDLYSDDGGNVKISDFCSSLYNLNFKTNLLTPI